MRTYRIQVTLRDGSQDEHNGLFTDGFAAVIHAMDFFPNAKRISATRLS